LFRRLRFSMLFVKEWWAGMVTQWKVEVEDRHGGSVWVFM
jgi:hypothetical protein